MIELTRLNGTKFIVNCDLIKFMESTPDTMITLSSGEKMMVKDPIQDILRKTIDYRKRLYQEPIVVGEDINEKRLES